MTNAFGPESLEHDLSLGDNRGFGRIPLSKNRATWAFRQASAEAARNLLHKAQHALDEDNEDRARAYVTRAVQLPFDEEEGAIPAAWEAHMLLFTAVTDALEDSDEDDTAWLDAALQALQSAGAMGRSCLATTLEEVAGDYELWPRERKRLMAAIDGIPKDRTPFIQPARDDLVEYVLEVIRTTNDYEDSLDALIG